MRTKKHVFVLFSFVLILLSACGTEPEPTPTPVPPTPEPIVQPPTQSPAELCAQEVAIEGNPDFPIIFCENFEDPAMVQMWVGEDENKWGALTTDTYRGKYTARVEVKRDNILTLSVPIDDVRDFAYQVEGRLASHSGHPYHSWGVFFKYNEDDSSYYYFMVDNNQYYYFQLIRGDRQTNLITGRRTEDLNPLDEGNTITIIGDGDTYSFYINGKYMEDFSDNRLVTGGVGIYSEMKQGTTLDWEFDNIAVASP